MNIICVVLVICGLLILLSIVSGYWFRERKMKRVCPLFRQSSYCSGENSIQKDDYLKRLGSLFDYNSELVAHVIRNHPYDFWNWIEGDSDYQMLCEDDSIERNMLCRYLSMLEVCSLFQIHGFISTHPNGNLPVREAHLVFKATSSQELS